MYSKFQNVYKADIISIVKSEKLAILVLCFITLENFNRPRRFRLAENIFGKRIGAKTFGIMQVTSEKVLNDRESILEGSKIVLSLTRAFERKSGKKFEDETDYGLNQFICEVALGYNKDSTYAEEIAQIFELFLNNHASYLNKSKEKPLLNDEEQESIENRLEKTRLLFEDKKISKAEYIRTRRNILKNI